MMPTERWEVIVVGAGAAGLLAATRSAERGRTTLLLEKNPRPGTKILMSGGTRCNITHATDARGIREAFGDQGKFLSSALAALGPHELIALIEAEGVPTREEPGRGKIFPASDKASDVLHALLRRLERSGAVLALSEPVEELQRADAGFFVRTSHRTLSAEKLIVTTGGMSYPGSGTTGDGYRWLASLGHTVVPLRPALTPVTTDAAWVTALRGIAIPDAVVRVVVSNRMPAEADEPRAEPRARRRGLPAGCLAERRESLLFTHFGVSGPAVLDVSRAISGHPNPRALDLECDLLPALAAAELDEQLRQECATEGKKQLPVFILRQLPRRLVEAILACAGISLEQRASELTKADRLRLVQTTKGLRIPVSGVRGFKVAEVTAGGVLLAEVDSRTMQSKLIPNLFLAGEVLDLDGPIGGYNFQAAFSTAWLAGESV